MRRGLYAVLFLLVSFMPASAEVRIEASPGGEASSFIEFFEQLRQSRERVVIDGPCFSACTLVLIIMPRSRICVTQRAVFGFHAAKAIDQYGREYPAPGGDARGGRRLSRADPQLDQAARRPDPRPHFSRRT